MVLSFGNEATLDNLCDALADVEAKHQGQDHATRYGGEEFAITLPNTALKQAIAVADQIRRAVMAKKLKNDPPEKLLGV
jgi:diguanylate cyclase